MNSNDNKGFLLQLHMRAEQKAKEYMELLHERQRLDMRIERTKEYVENLNNFLRAEGQPTVTIKPLIQSGSVVGKPGNRAKGVPTRKIQWEGMTINQIIERILSSSPTVSFHPKDVAYQIYEIETDADLRRVIRNVRTTMQRGAKAGMWEKTGRAEFKAKTSERQGAFVNT